MIKAIWHAMGFFAIMAGTYLILSGNDLEGIGCWVLAVYARTWSI